LSGKNLVIYLNKEDFTGGGKNYMTINSKIIGNNAENDWATFLKNRGIDKLARRDKQSGGGNKEKSDIGNSLNINFEVKAGNQVPKKLEDFYAQSLNAACKTHTIPYVILKRRFKRQDEFLVVMNGFDWADLYKRAREPKKVDSADREIGWALKGVIMACKKLLKLVDV